MSSRLRLVCSLVHSFQEEGEYEYASYKHEAEQEASFGPGVRFTIADTTEGHAEDAVIKTGESQGQGKNESAPEEQCSGGREGPRMFDTGSGPGRRESVRGVQCPRRAPGYYRNRPRRSGGGVQGYVEACEITGAKGAVTGAVGGMAFGPEAAAPGGGVGAVVGCGEGVIEHAL
jgi:hypothetical protein